MRLYQQLAQGLLFKTRKEGSAIEQISILSSQKRSLWIARRPNTISVSPTLSLFTCKYLVSWTDKEKIFFGWIFLSEYTDHYAMSSYTVRLLLIRLSCHATIDGNQKTIFLWRFSKKQPWMLNGVKNNYYFLVLVSFCSSGLRYHPTHTHIAYFSELFYMWPDQVSCVLDIF